MLTAAEVRRLKARARAELLAAGALVSELLVADLKRKRPHAAPLNATVGPRERYSVAVLLSPAERRTLERKAAAERRSPSSYAAAVLVRELARASV